MHAAGVPALAGGAAFGADASRAEALGADAWAPDIARADHQLHTWLRCEPPAVRPAEHAPPGASAYHELDVAHADVVRTAYGELWERLPALGSYTERQLAHTRADLSWIVDFLEAAVLTEDPSVLTDLLRWLAQVLASRGVPASVLPPTLASLATAVDDLPTARQHLRSAADAAELSPSSV